MRFSCKETKYPATFHLNPIRIAIVGDGRMARMMESVCIHDDRFEIAGFVGPDTHAHLDEIQNADAVIDFSYPGNLSMVLECVKNRNLPLVIGTTGLSVQQSSDIRAASHVIPIVWSSNFSVGVTVLVRLARLAAESLGKDFDIEITETHHHLKEDAPSGTAKMLLSAVSPSDNYTVINGREGRPGKRGREIGVHALRGGTVAGEHSIYYFGQMEEIELRHRADSREIFARGALRAVRFAMQAEAGLYDMEDVLFGGK